MLRQAEAALPGTFVGTLVIEHPHIAAWREPDRKLGSTPKNYPLPVENLTGRALNGAQIGHFNNLVSLYNTISLRHILPVGAEDLGRITGD
jgi:DNA/RNA-binding domain of Phe-tRNA-synthetase-like protein